MIYYQEKDSGDYLCIDERSWRYYKQIYPQDSRRYEGRATAITGQVSSVCTTSLTIEYLRENCKRVLKKDIPQDWLEMLV